MIIEEFIIDNPDYIFYETFEYLSRHSIDTRVNFMIEWCDDIDNFNHIYYQNKRQYRLIKIYRYGEPTDYRYNVELSYYNGKLYNDLIGLPLVITTDKFMDDIFEVLTCMGKDDYKKELDYIMIPF